MPTIEERYRREFAKHEVLARQAKFLLPDGVSSDSRVLAPFPLYMKSAKGAHKWDLEGRRFIDLWSGHGALLFGHAAPEMVKAVSEQVALGSHYGACHEGAKTWAQMVKDFFPAAQSLRFTGSGTEANLLALHLAKAFTGRTKILRFDGHYHGWYADVNVSASVACPVSRDPVLERAGDNTVQCANNIEALKTALQTHPDIAAVILEPTGPCSGVVPLPHCFLQELRSLTHEHGSLLIFDEVVTGFRMAPGGAQQLTSVKPDILTLAKILSGGMPGGAIAGRREILELLSSKGSEAAAFPDKISHLGTFSANPVSARAGIATLRRIDSDKPHASLEACASELKNNLNGVIDEHGLDWAVYGQGSCIKFLIGHGVSGVKAMEFEALEWSEARLLQRGNAKVRHLLRLALLLEGVDMSLSSFVTTAHTAEDICEITRSFDSAISELKQNKVIL